MSVDRNGDLHDHFGGQEDLASGRVRFVGDADQRIKEDYLRILRWFRFDGRFGRTDADNRQAIKAISDNVKGLEGISGERFWQELSKIAMHPSAAKEIALMARLGVAEAIHLPTSTIGSDGAITAMLPPLNPIGHISMSPIARLAPLFHDADAVERLDQRWKLSLPERREAMFLVENRERAMDPLKVWERFILDTHDDKRDADGGRHEHPTRTERRTLVVHLLAIAGRLAEAQAIAEWSPIPFPISGADLIAAGIPAGPERGRAMSSLRNRWIDSDYSLNRDDLLGGLLEQEIDEVPKP